MIGYQHPSAVDSGFLRVDSIHQIYYEQYGNSNGKPVVYLHGGPGGETSPSDANFFNPEVYRVILFDQRGAGKSIPSAELRDNTSQHLVSDIETLRLHLNISKWHLVFGGSWGSTLALLYAQTHPEMVGHLVIRGIFLITKAELDWVYSGTLGYGAGGLFPEAHESFVNFLPEQDRGDPIEAYHGLLTSDDANVRLSAARAFNAWDLRHGALFFNPRILKKLDDERWSLTHALFETHYFKHGAWFEEGQLTRKENIDRIRHIPTTIVHGRYDTICPPKAAWDLHKAFPEAELVWVPDAGHSASEPGTFQELVKACDKYGEL